MSIVTTAGLRGVFYACKYALKHQENFFPICKSYRFYGRKIRISASALLLIERDDKYVLVQNHHRPEQYAPFGGVYKHDTPAPEVLEQVEWVPDYTSHQPKLEDMKNDLRGIVYGKHFPTFLDWFTQRVGREGETCLLRELREELQEGKVGKIVREKAGELSFSLVRRVVEGPNPLEDRDYAAQFRYFEIFRPQVINETGRIFVDELFKRATQGDNNMRLVTRSEIQWQRTVDRSFVIGAHTKYFFSSRWHGQEPARY